MTAKIKICSTGLVALALLALCTCGKQTAGAVAGADAVADAGAGAAPSRIQPSRPAPVDDPNAVERLATAMRQATPGGNIDAVIEAFARAGILVLEDDGETPVQALAGSPSPFLFSRSEAAALAHELASGLWGAGASLDAFVERGSAVSLSDVVFSYVSVGDTFGARLGRALVADQTASDGARLRVPVFVLALFLADVFPRLFSVDSHNKTIDAHAARLVSPCGVVDTLFAPVRKVFEGALRESFATSMGAAMIRSIAESRGLSEDAARSGLTALSGSFRMLAATVHFAALAPPGSVRIVGPTAPVHHRVAGDASPDVVMRAHVERGASPPTWAVACASERGAAFRAVDVENVTVVWRAGEGFDAHASFGSATTTHLDDAGEASVSVRLKEESAETHAAGALKSANIEVLCDVERAPYDALGSSLASLLGSTTARTVLSDFGADVFNRLAAAMAPPTAAPGRLAITYHE